ncbi:hypothetical protein BHY_0964 (plasmid) [Borrelia nietonii YOR]|uniref:Uncharacterized protein n=2 Tax=Borrelia TaxID=138 RepID=W5SAF4_9SPIR|nr:hypothetical protein BHY_0964 [Borrelia nietonii YOR]AHH14399.1 hypothetical protein BHW_0900004 [Borrelia hermsii MTW]
MLTFVIDYAFFYYHILRVCKYKDYCSKLFLKGVKELCYNNVN